MFTSDNRQSNAKTSSFPKCPFICCCAFISLLIGLLVVAIIFGAIGTAEFVNARRDHLKHSTETECLVVTKSLSTVSCVATGESVGVYMS